MLRRRRAAGVGAVLLAGITAAPAGATDLRDTSCPPGFTSGALTLEERLLLPKVQARRLFPTRVIQAGQKAAQDNVIGTVLSGRPITGAPWPVSVLDRFPLLQRIPGRIIGLGLRRERVASPLARRAS